MGTCLLENPAGATKTSTNLTVMEEKTNQCISNQQQISSETAVQQQENSSSSSATSHSCQKQSFVSQTHVTTSTFSQQSSTAQHIQNQSSQQQQEKITTSKTMHVKRNDKIRIDIQFKDGSKSDLTFTNDGTPLTDSNQDGIANDIATLTITNAEPKHSGMYQCIMKTAGGEAKC